MQNKVFTFIFILFFTAGFSQDTTSTAHYFGNLARKAIISTQTTALILPTTSRKITTLPDTLKNDSSSFSRFSFKQEKGGAVCVNGLEKLEIAWTSDRSFIFVNQLHYYAPWIFEGRVFLQAEQEKTEKAAIHFFDLNFDFTVREFPIHIGYNLGIDQMGEKPNVSYSGFSGTAYLSDIRRVKIPGTKRYFDIHKHFHILRVGMSYLNLSEHLQTVHSTEDSASALKPQLEYNGFFQLQPLHLTHDLSIFSEGMYRKRGENSFTEVELGLKHEKILKGLIGFGGRVSFRNKEFRSLEFLIRLNISNANPKHN